MKDKSVIYICKSFPDVRGVKWINTMQQKGYNVIVLTEIHKTKIQVWTYDVQVIELCKKGKLSDTYIPRNYIEKIKTEIEKRSIRPNIIFLRDIFQANLAIKLKRYFNSKLYIDIADNYPEVMKMQFGNTFMGKLLFKVFNSREKRTILESDKVILVTNESKRYLGNKHGLNNSDWVVVRNLPERSIDRNQEITETFNSDVTRIVYIGSYSNKVRDFETIISILKENEKIKFDIYTFQIDEVKKTFQEIDIKKIGIYKPIQSNDLQSILSNYDIGIIPHFRGGGTDFTEPNKLYDYIHAGCPVLSSNNPSLSNTLERYKVGEVYTPGSKESFNVSLDNLRRNYHYYQQNCIAAKQVLVWENEVQLIFNEVEN